MIVILGETSDQTMRKHVTPFLLAFVSSTLVSGALPTPPELWAGFNPDKGPWNEEVIREETKDGIYSRDSYISAYVLGEEVRVYCKYAVKAGATNAPGLMNVHGWMGAPSIDRSFVNDGWAVMAHDYCGKTGNRPHTTRYPQSLRHGNMDGKEGVRIKSRLPDDTFITDPKQTDDYLWYAIQRRVLSYLLAQKAVDSERIGAKGYSYGGTIMWNLGMDPRVKAIVAYFGVGWLEYYRSRSVWMYDQPPGMPDLTPGEQLYLSAVAPQAHAPHMTAASLWLNGTNDHHGGHERGEETFKHFKAGVPWSFAHQPRGHHDTHDIEQNTKRWLEKHVLGKDIHWPDQAASNIALDAHGVPELRIAPADPDKVTDLKMYYALKNPVSFGRAWRDAETTRQGDTWVGTMPVLNVEDYVFGFSNIRYDNTVVRSSPFTAAIPSKLGNAVATDEPSTDLGESTATWFNTGPVEGKGGIAGFRVLTARGTFNQQFSDPKWQAPEDAQLHFKFYCTQPQQLQVDVNDHYRATIEITASNDWQEMTLQAKHFINRHNQQPLKDWSQTAKIAIKPAPGADITQVVFANFNWTLPKKAPPEPKPDRASEVKALPQVRTQLEPFLETYCIHCHGPKRQKGQIRFDTATWEITHNDNAQRWQDVLDQLNGGDMPPEDEKQPPGEELAGALRALTGAVVEARRRLTDHGGEIKMRRLNQREYSATIRHLFGFGVLPDDIPEDGEVASFDTVGAEQFFTSAHFEKYLKLGKKVVEASFRANLSPRRKTTTERTEPEARVTQNMRDKLADLDRKRTMKKAGATWQEMGFDDEGEMQVTFQQWDSRAELPRRYLQYPLIDTGVYISDVAKWASTARHTDIRGEYILRIHGGVVGEPDELRKIVRLWEQYRIHGTLKMAGTPENPQSVEMRVSQPMGRSHLAVMVRENVPDHTINSMRGYIQKLDGPGEHTDPRAAVWIDWLEIEGPYYPDQRPKIEDLFYPGMLSGGRSPYIWDDAKIPELIEQFVFEAFRHRAPDPDYLAGLHQLFTQNRAAGISQREALTEVMALILASPGFLFIQEHEPGENSPPRTLDQREWAIRLSYFLWSCPPDDELYAADLSDPDTYARQVDRMLADPKAVALRDGFISQWAEFDRYDAITVDTREHIRFNEGVQQDAKQEVREFFGMLIDENLPARQLIDANVISINHALAVHYGLDLPNQKNAAFQKVRLPSDSPLGGLMTQTAFLVTGSNGERSSPVIRGALILEKLLHDKPPPPPPNVPELSAASDIPKSNREMVELHQQQAVCASCHKKMDVIGFGLENFDPIGRWRDTEKVGRKQVPIEPGGTLPDGSVFSNVQELKAVLLEHEADLAQELAESLLTYALGRTIEFSDADDVEQLLSRLEGNDFRVRSMIREIALSPLFRKK
ncbi:MAG: dienelactone hydrolase [Kiritimatiellia bacterium]|jgi:dienelactone hydrolase